MPYVFSTMSADVAYTEYHPKTPDQPFDVPKRRVLVKGGHGVADKKLVTPHGVATRVDEEELAFLESNAIFQLHKKNGFISVSEKKKDPEKVAADMVTFDRTKDAAPINPGEFKNTEGNKVKLDNVGAF